MPVLMHVHTGWHSDRRVMHAHTQVGIPIAVYYFCFNTVFGEQGLSPVHDFNWRVNYSGFAAIAAVQVRVHALCLVCVTHTRMDDV